MMLVDFESKLDKEHVLNDDPWNMYKSIVLLKKYDGMQQIGKLVLIEAALWIWIHDLSLMGWNTYMGKEIGD